MNSLLSLGFITFAVLSAPSLTWASCAPQPSGIAHKTSPDTASAFLQDVYYSERAQAADAPQGYTAVFSNTQASPNAPKYLGYMRLTSYDVAACAQQCGQVKGCESFNVYFERDPSVKPDSQSCSNPSSFTNIKCAWWGSRITLSDNVNHGHYRRNFQVVIAGSNGYVKTAVTSSTGSTTTISSTTTKSSVATSTSGPTYTPDFVGQGCYTDSPARTLEGREIVNTLGNSAEFCATACGLIGFSLAGTEYASQCYCGNTIANGGNLTDSTNCNQQCSGNSSETCGGFYAMNLYKINNPRQSNNNTAFPLDCANEPLKSEAVCDLSKTREERVASLIALMTLDEKVQNVVSSSAGAIRLGLLPYEWWNEALHGVAGPEAGSKGTLFSNQEGAEWSFATSFPEIINMGATFDDSLVAAMAGIIGQEARAFANNGRAGFDFWTPNINPFRDPRWGRGLETPGESPMHIQSYVRQLIPGLQQRTTDTAQLIATCKHFAVYDIEQNRYGNNLDPSQHDLEDYYLPSFRACVRDARALSVMCSYNAVDGIPACASPYLLQDLLRSDYFDFNDSYNYVVSDCDAVANIFDSHGFTNDYASAAAVALNAGCDLDCGTTYLSLTDAISNGYTNETMLDISLSRLYGALFTVGMFDGTSPFSSLGWSSVNTANAQALTYQSALESMTLLKNDGTLPLKGFNGTFALVGPMAAATYQMQGNYYGPAPYLISPLAAFQAQYNAVFAQGTGVATSDSSGFAAAIAAAQSADAVIYIGGIDTSVEAEGLDRTTITWPGNQLELIAQLGELGKPLIVVQWGGGQIDDTALLNNKNVSALLWAGYPGQDGGRGIRDIITGVWSVAGRLPVTQYPANYVDQIDIYDMNLRPIDGSPGRTYKWYTEQPVLPLGHGLHYTNFSFSWAKPFAQSYSIQNLVSTQTMPLENANFASVAVSVKNTGGPANMFSDYVALLYASTENAGPTPYPNKWLIAYTRAHNIAVGSTSEMALDINLGAMARANDDGDLVLYPGTYRITLDNDASLSINITLTGSPAVIQSLPKPGTYTFSVPVHTQGPTT